MAGSPWSVKEPARVMFRSRSCPRWRSDPSNTTILLFRVRPIIRSPFNGRRIVVLSSGMFETDERLLAEVQAIQAGQSSHVYTIAVPRDLLGLWLAPRLAAFRRDNPQVRYALVAGDAELDFTQANLDLAIRYGEGPGELEGAALGDIDRVLVSPTDPDAAGVWIGWPGDPAPDGEEPALSVADAGLAISAAAAGLGRARVPALLADAALAAGQRIVLGSREPCRRGYWLVAPTPQWRQKKVKALVGWLTG